MAFAGEVLSPLFYAILTTATSQAPRRPKYTEKVQILLDEGADPMLEIGNHPSPLSFAARGASEENVEDSSEVKAVWKEMLRLMKRKVESSE